jgi:hypothetical protein
LPKEGPIDSPRRHICQWKFSIVQIGNDIGSGIFKQLRKVTITGITFLFLHIVMNVVLCFPPSATLPSCIPNKFRVNGIHEYEENGTKRKIKEYERAYNIQQTDRSSIFFFAIETSGGLWGENRSE